MLTSLYKIRVGAIVYVLVSEGVENADLDYQKCTLSYYQNRIKDFFIQRSVPLEGYQLESGV